MSTHDWGNLSKAKILVIGHDPRLQTSSTIAAFCFFADYYFRDEPKQGSEKAKYNLAKNVFEYISEITSNKFQKEEIYITNLCNTALPSVSKGQTVFIPKQEAQIGLNNINYILNNSKIHLVFAMSVQVNFWLQKLELYSSGDDFLKCAEPNTKYSVGSNPHYKAVKEKNLFKLICGRKFRIRENVFLYPILHIKSRKLSESQYSTHYNKMGQDIVSF